MSPTLSPGDYVVTTEIEFDFNYSLIDKLFPGINNVSRRDIVVVTLHPDNNRFIIKRVAALPGDTIFVRNGELYINSKRQLEPYVSIPMSSRSTLPGSWHFSYLLPEIQGHKYSPAGDNWGPLVVPDEAYFVLGDNRSKSGDSRRFGFVYADEICSKSIAHFHLPL